MAIVVAVSLLTAAACGSDSGTDSDDGTDTGTDSDDGTDTGTDSDDGTDTGTDSDDGTDTGTDSDDGTDTTVGSTPTSELAAGVSDDPLAHAAEFVNGSNYAEFLGTAPGKTPIKLGWFNEDGGALGRPWYSAVVGSAVRTVNEWLGGVQGHPIELVPCESAGTVEAAQTCAQEFVNDPDIVAVLGGVQIVGGATFTATLAGAKPHVGFFPLGPEYAPGVENTYMLSGGGLNTNAMFQAMAEGGATSAAFFAPDSPQTRGLVDPYAAFASTFGIEFSGVFYPAGAGDITPTVQSANLNDYGAIYNGAQTASACITHELAFQSAGVETPVYALPSCGSAEVIEALGDIPQYRYTYFGTNTKAQQDDPEVVIAMEAADEFDVPVEDIEQVHSTLAFGMVLTVARVLASSGPDSVTSESFATAISEYQGPVFSGPPSVRFGVAPYPTVGAIAARIWEYQGDDIWNDIYGGWNIVELDQ